MRISTKRALVAGAFFALVTLGLFVDTGLGTPCSFGWDFVASVCPVGVFAAMLAGRAVPATGIICLGVTVVVALLVGRAFCGWLCPVPLTRRLFGGRRAVARSAARDSYIGRMADEGRYVTEAPARPGRRGRGAARAHATADERELACEWRGPALGSASARAHSVREEARSGEVAEVRELELACVEWRGPALGATRAAACGGRAAGVTHAGAEVERAGEWAPLPWEAHAGVARRETAPVVRRVAAAERDLAACEWRGPALAPRVGATKPAGADMAPEARGRGLGDIRVIVFVLAMACALAFGFPVFCLVCPVGLTFATLVMVVQVVRTGVFTWAVVAFPVVVALELTVLRRWCHAVCPIGWLLSVVARGNRTLRPAVAHDACLREQGKPCHACYKACPEGIDLHAPAGRARLNACTKCAECVFACPVQAVEMPILPKH